MDESAYISALLADLTQELREIEPRPLLSIFMGGGTPSLFSPSAIARLLGGIQKRLGGLEDLEITLEANPGALEAEHFAGYRDAGVNRLSIGVQSFDDGCLKALGRIHDPDQAWRAVQLAKSAGYERINLDLMFGLPGQSESNAKLDVSTALELDPGHISYYQLTLEPNTVFHHSPPVMPDEEMIWQFQEQGQRLIGQADYTQYEISAYARDGHRCRHNCNYWTFGDYLGIGAGAHGKFTHGPGKISRSAKWRHPRDYLSKVALGQPNQFVRTPECDELILEFMMNRLRLHDGFSDAEFERCTGLPVASISAVIAQAEMHSLLKREGEMIVSTNLGRSFLNDLLALFTPG